MGSGHSHWVRGSVPLLSSSTLTPLLLLLPYNLVSGSFYCSTFMNRTNDGRQIGFTALRTTSNVISLGLFFQPSTHTKWTSIVSRPCRKGYSFSQFCNFSVLEASRKIHHRSLAALCEAATNKELTSELDMGRFHRWVGSGRVGHKIIHLGWVWLGRVQCPKYLI